MTGFSIGAIGFMISSRIVNWETICHILLLIQYNTGTAELCYTAWTKVIKLHLISAERVQAVSEIQESLEWRSILDSLRNVTVEKASATLGERGVIAYTDGACIKNPGGPAGWSVILASIDYAHGEHIDEDAPRIECYGHIPRSPGTTNNRAEIAAVLAALCLAPRDKPLTVHSDSEYTIKVASGVFQ